MEIKFEINKELTHKWLLSYKPKGNNNNGNWCIILNNDNSNNSNNSENDSNAYE